MLGTGAAEAVKPHGAFAIEKWDTEKGLPNNVVVAMTQTRDGYLWLGTLDGLVPSEVEARMKQKAKQIAND